MFYTLSVFQPYELVCIYIYVVGNENHTGHNKFLGNYIVSTLISLVYYLHLFYRSDSGRRRSSASHDIIKRKGSLASISQSTDEDGVRTPTESRRGSDIRTKFIAVREQYHPAKAKLKTFTHFIENNRQHIFFLVIFFGVTFALFAERFYRKSTDHSLKLTTPHTRTKICVYKIKSMIFEVDYHFVNI